MPPDGTQRPADTIAPVTPQTVLVVDDEETIAEAVRARLESEGYRVLVAGDGGQAIETAARERPDLVVLDLMLPGMDGLEVCKELQRDRWVPVLMLTARTEEADKVAGFAVGADDYLTKPFDPEELRARVQAGTRIVSLQQQLRTHVTELEAALASVRQLRGLVPICSYCKAIRDDKQYWHRLESYISENSEAQFTHSICPTCYEAISADLDKV